MRRTLASCFLLLLLAGGCRKNEGNSREAPPEPNWAERRAGMVTELADGGVENARVLEAMGRVERHRFVPRDMARQAYLQSPLPIGEDQTISSPYIVARMTEMLELEGNEKTLEIGTGSGYQAAVLSLLVPHVYSIEIRPALAERARERLADLGYPNVTILTGDGYKGWPSEAPFDVIIVTAAPRQVPEALVEQLAPGGRLVVPVGDPTKYQLLTLIRKDQAGVVTREKGERVRFVPMIHKTD